MNKKLLWYLKAQAGVLLFPMGLCLLGEAVIHKGSGQPWFWLGTLSLIVVNTGIGLMIESGLISGFPRDEKPITQSETSTDFKPE
jgi:hypothetical protein